MRGSGWLLVVAALAAAACEDGGFPAGPQTPGAGDGGTVPVSERGLPCDVDAVLARNCRRCHADPPVVGAPMPLLTWEQIHRPAASDPSVQVHQMMRIRINDPDDPMPPNDDLSAADRAVLDAWLAAGAPRESCETEAPPPPPPAPVGPDALPCEPTHAFNAHAAGNPTEQYHVPEDAGNSYMCFTFRSPFNGTQQATAWAPMIDDSRVLHHWILYRTAQPQPEGGVMRCQMPGDATFVAGWAPGGENYVMPDDVGLELPGSSEWLILQVHYWNVARLTDADDSSGVAFCTTDTPRTHEAGIFTLGKAPFFIPPRTNGHEVTGLCPSWTTRFLATDLHILASFPHMHQLGTSIRTEILRGGDDGPIDMLVNVERWDFESQTFYPNDPPMVFRPGDAARTTCVYDNPSADGVWFGENTENEMCFNFVLLYPVPDGSNRNCGVL